MGITVHYHSIDGKYLKRKGTRDGLWMKNKRDKQIHSLLQRPVYPQGKPQSFSSFEEWLESPDPPEPLDPDMWVAHYEWGSFWPIPFIDTEFDADSLHQEVITAYEEYYQREAVAKASKDDNATIFTSMGMLITAAIGAFFAILTGIAAINLLVFGG